RPERDRVDPLETGAVTRGPLTAPLPIAPCAGTVAAAREVHRAGSQDTSRGARPARHGARTEDTGTPRATGCTRTETTPHRFDAHHVRTSSEVFAMSKPTRSPMMSRMAVDSEYESVQSEMQRLAAMPLGMSDAEQVR